MVLGFLLFLLLIGRVFIVGQVLLQVLLLVDLGAGHPGTITT